MKIKLLEDVHIKWCPKGAAGNLIKENFANKFFPDYLLEGCPWENGIYIGSTKYEVISA